MGLGPFLFWSKVAAPTVKLELMNYYVTGINGSGKTTVLKAIAGKTNFKIIAASQELIKFLGIETYEQLRAIPQDQVLERYAMMVSGLLERHKNENLLFDTHLLNLTNGRIIDRTGPWIGRFDGLILIDANAEQVWRRVEADDARERALFPENFDNGQKFKLLKEYSAATRERFVQVADKYRLPNKIITNRQNEVATAVEDFVRFDASLRT